MSADSPSLSDPVLKVRFVTIIPHGENLELRKDPGQIPYQLHRLAGFDATLVTYFYSLHGGRNAGPLTVPPDQEEIIAGNYPFLKSEVPGLKIHFLKNEGRCKFFERAIYKYLRQNARNIDILNLFHFNTENIFYTFLFRILNPKGKVYLKLDIDLVYYRARPYFYNTSGILSFFRKFCWEYILFPLFFRLVHLITAEHQDGLTYFQRRFHVPQAKLHQLSNGVDEGRIRKLISSPRDFSQKENMLITVGRIGTLQKNNGFLLQALAGMELQGWKVCFIGEIEQDFKAVIDEFFKANKHLTDRIFFTGKISSPVELYRYFDRAKLFCLTSLNEGFPLSACEAAYFGNYLVLSDRISGFNEMTGGGKCGVQVGINNSSVLREQLTSLLANPAPLEKSYSRMRKYATENLTWEANIPKLKKLLT